MFATGRSKPEKILPPKRQPQSHDDAPFTANQHSKQIYREVPLLFWKGLIDTAFMASLQDEYGRRTTELAD